MISAKVFVLRNSTTVLGSVESLPSLDASLKELASGWFLIIAQSHVTIPL